MASSLSIKTLHRAPVEERYRMLIRSIFGACESEFSEMMGQDVDAALEAIRSREADALRLIYNLATAPNGQYCKNVEDVRLWVLNLVHRKMGVSRKHLYHIWKVALRMLRHPSRSKFLKRYVEADHV